MFIHQLYLYNQKIPEKYLSQVAQIVNNGIIEFNKKYSNNIEPNYTVERIRLSMRVFNVTKHSAKD